MQARALLAAVLLCAACTAPARQEPAAQAGGPAPASDGPDLERAADEAAVASQELARASEETARASAETAAAAAETARSSGETALAAEQTARASKETSLASWEAELASWETELASRETALAAEESAGASEAPRRDTTLPATEEPRSTAARGAGRRARSGERAAESSAPPRALTLHERVARARAAFAALSDRERREVVDWFGTEVQNLATFQTTLQRYVQGEVDVDPGTWPLAAPTPFFDPVLHAPAQPIERKLLPPDAPRVIAMRAQVLGTVEPRDLRSGWVYDYAAREPRRLADEGDPVRVFDNALLGMPPGWDYAEVLVERMLDDGSQQVAAAAFAHAFTDRVGGVYPGITLYDAWASRTDIEMPDVDCLGIVHVVLDDWQTWKAVVPDDQQQPLYARIGELFFALHRHRGLRHNLARTFLCGSTELRDAYQNHSERFHALWESASSTPAQLASKLPDSATWAEFLQDWSDTLEGDETLFLKGIRRQYQLDRDARDVRALLFRLLDEYGAYDRLTETSAAEAGSNVAPR